MLRKMISFLMAALMLVYALPMDALAELPSIRDTDAVISAARQLVAEEPITVDDDSDSIDGMNTAGLEAWLDSFVSQDVEAVAAQVDTIEAASDIDTQVPNTQAYDYITSDEAHQEVMETWAEAESSRFIVEDELYALDQNLYAYDNEESTEEERLKAYLRIYEGLERLEEIKTNVASQVSEWRDTIEQHVQAVKEVTENNFTTALSEEHRKEAEQIGESIMLRSRDTNAEIKVHVLNTEETGLTVHDESGNPIQGAKLVLVDHNNASNRIEGTSDENGIIVVNIKQFTLDELKCACVDGVLTADNRRTVRFEGFPVKPGECICSVRTMYIDNGEPYIEGVSLRGVDIMLAKDSIYVTPKNDIDHDLKVYINTKGASGKVTVGFNEDNVSKTESADFRANMSCVTFTRPWCQNLTISSSIYVYLTSEGANGANESMQLPVTISKAVVTEPTEAKVDVLSCTILTDIININIPLGDGKCLKSLDIGLSFPWSDIQGLMPRFTITPNGGYYVALNFGGSKIGKGDWKLDTDKSFEKLNQWRSEHGSLLKSMEESGTLKRSEKNPNLGTVQGGKFTASFYAYINGQLQQLKDGTTKNHANTVLSFLGSCAYNYTKYVLAYAIPFYFGLEGGFKASASIQLESNHKIMLANLVISLYELLVSDKLEQIVLQVMPYLSVFAGAGIQGVAGVSLMGIAGYKFTYTRSITEKARSLIGNFSFNLNLIVEFFFLKVKQNIVSLDKEKWARKVLWHKEYDKTDAAEAESDTDSDTGSDTIVLQAEPIDGMPSSVLEASTEKMQIGEDLPGTLDAIAMKNRDVYFYNDDQNRPILKWSNGSGGYNEKCLDELEMDSAPASKCKQRFSCKTSYIYDVSMLADGDYLYIYALCADYADDVEKDVEQEDGTVIKTKVPGKTYLRGIFVWWKDDNTVKLFYDMAAHDPLVSDPKYDGILQGLDTCYCGRAKGGNNQAVLGMYVMASLNEKKQIRKFTFVVNRTDSGNSPDCTCEVDERITDMNSIMKYAVYKCENIVSVIPSSLQWKTDYLDLVSHNAPYSMLTYVIFTDTRGDTYIMSDAVTKKAYCFQENGFTSAVLTNNITRTDPWAKTSGTDHRCSMFGTVKQSDGRYRLVRYETVEEEGKSWVELRKAEEYNVYTPNAYIGAESAFGMDILYWLDQESAYEGENVVSQHVLKCIYIKESGTDFYMTKPFVMMTFSTNDFPTETTSLDSLRMVNGREAHQGIVRENRTGDDGQTQSSMVRFTYKQALECKINGATVDNPVIKLGDKVSVLFNITNTGNQPLSSGKIRITDLSRPDAKPSEVSINFLDPESSYSVINDGEHEYRLEGLAAVCEYDGASATDDEMLMIRETDGALKVIEYNMLLPGETRTYHVSFNIPAEWGSGDKTLRCEFSEYTVNASLDTNTGLYVAACSFADGATCYDATDGTITQLFANDAERVSITFAAVNDTTDGDAEIAVAINNPSNVQDNQLVGFSASSSSDADALSSDILLPGATMNLRANYYYENGERMIEIEMSNPSFEGAKNIQLCSYADDSETPCATFDLTESYLLESQYSLNVTMPEEQLTGGQRVDILTLRMSGETEDGRKIESNGSCCLNLDERILIVQNPEDVCIQTYGTDAVYQITATGGAPLYYQWQLSVDHGATWENITGANESVLRFGKKQTTGLLASLTTAYAEDTHTPHTSDNSCNGWLFRCVVSGNNGTVIASDAAKLTFAILPDTGDDVPYVQMLILCALCLVMLVLLRRRGRAH